MRRPAPRIDENRFAGWSPDRLARYARARVAYYTGPVGPWTPGERALLRAAWAAVLPGIEARSAQQPPTSPTGDLHVHRRGKK
ncbi:hypothetical protein GXC69_12035 [Candidatus Macondimonas diazotrophica]|jgi:hypothetical protein|nr:hypothetical protein [Candidatus Macondimonas diazotrophica]